MQQQFEISLLGKNRRCYEFAKKFLEDNGNDLAALALILGHSNIQTTARYAAKDQSKLAEAAENIVY